jgi:hypothetical protein
MPLLTAAVAVFAELPVALAIAGGAFVRPSAVLQLSTRWNPALIGHRYWRATGAGRVASMDGCYKKAFDRWIAQSHRAIAANIDVWYTQSSAKLTVEMQG